MQSGVQDKRFTQIGIAVMLALLAILGLRSAGTVRAVLAPIAGPTATAEAAAPAGVNISALCRRDSLIDEAVPGRRDPFRTASAAGPRLGRVVSGGEAASPAAKPGLCALLYDNINPTAQVSLDGVRSGWLRPGDEFQGWRVTAITKDSVTMTKGAESIALP